MSGDKFSAVWVSHTSISDFTKCSRSYYLKHMYRNPKTGHKIKIMSPPLALGQTVHEVLEALSVLPTQERFKESLVLRLDKVWPKVSGKRGGFSNPEVEAKYRQRAESMLLRVMNNPGVLAKPAVKIKESLPHYWLSPEKNIILCGKIDWLEYIPETDSVNIIDFKTSKYEEDGESLQLPIYCLIVENCQKRKATKVSYWYLDKNDEPTDQKLPNCEEASEKVLDIAIQMKTARQLQVFKCVHGGCNYCKPYEAVLRDEGEYVGVDEFNNDIYIFSGEYAEGEESVIL